jgi:dTDP-4-dehydrorhamnose 3,5-epimerase
MKILEIQALSIPAVKVVRFARFSDLRGYFTEPYRRSDFDAQLPFLKNSPIVQINESYSGTGVVRGLHFQWNPFMGKLVRTVHGRMVDLFLDIRQGSPTYGKAAAFALPSAPESTEATWIWVPPGFAHGNYFTEPSTIEYLCNGEYSPGCEAGISPVSPDIDWSLCDPALFAEFRALTAGAAVISDKDKAGLSLQAWSTDPQSSVFTYADLGAHG